MKECPNCRKVYGDGLFFCLDDGSPLRAISDGVDPNAPTVAALAVTPSLRTEVLPSRPAPPTVLIDAPLVTTPVRSKAPYVVIGILLLVCLGLSAALVINNLDRLDRQSDSPPANISSNEAIPASPAPAPSKTGTSKTIAPAENNSIVKEPLRPTPIGFWIGTWSTDSGTLFDFELKLSGVGDGRLTGFIKWTMRRTARPDKESKVGLSATEWVEGKFDPTDSIVQLKGQRKDDPNNVLVMLDEYRLKMSADGNSLIGLARNGGKWNGNVRLSRRVAAE